MPYLNVDTGGAGYTPVPVPIYDRTQPSSGTAVLFNRKLADNGGHWGGASAPDVVCKGGSGLLAKGVLELNFEDFTTGTEIQIQQVEYDNAGNIVEWGGKQEFYAPTEHDLLDRGDPAHDISRRHERFPVFAYVNAGHRLAFRVRQFHDSLTYTDPEGVERPFRIGVIAWARCTLEINPIPA